MKSLLRYVCLFLLTVADGKVLVSVFYETLCPDSIAFIREQLFPTVNQIGEIMTVDLVPYGKAQHRRDKNNKLVFDCQHGPDECLGNMIQSCGIRLVNNYNVTLPFVYCMESDPEPEKAGSKCANEHHMDYSIIQRCISTDQGKEFLAAEGDRTHSLVPRLTFVPWIIINGVHNDGVQWLSLRNLKKVVCDSYSGPKPSSCFSR